MASIAHSEDQEFRRACQTALKFLHEQIGFPIWVVVEKLDGQYTAAQVLHCDGPSADKIWLEWASLLCQHWERGSELRFAHDVRDLNESATIAARLVSDVCSFIGAPWLASDGSISGAVCGFDLQSRDSARHVPLVEFVAQVLSAIQRLDRRLFDFKQRCETLEAQVVYDELTGLYNRRGWEQVASVECDRSRRHGRPWTVFYVDIDQLKSVNDREGHPAGDALLRRAGHAIRACLRHHDLAARVGGDEFAVLATECDATHAVSIAQRLRTTLAEHGVEASIGHATGGTDDAPDVIVAAADRHMLLEKQRRGKRND
ncbi:MAG TPA: diguanylate cyclase [Pirellulaceae bacterium]|nr:diguanylate cyclase [Pirellulaceae bacterium]